MTLDEAVMAERKRCADIADYVAASTRSDKAKYGHLASKVEPYDGTIHVVEWIAGMIRQGDVVKTGAKP